MPKVFDDACFEQLKDEGRGKDAEKGIPFSRSQRDKRFGESVCSIKRF